MLKLGTYYVKWQFMMNTLTVSLQIHGKRGLKFPLGEQTERIYRSLASCRFQIDGKNGGNNAQRKVISIVKRKIEEWYQKKRC